MTTVLLEPFDSFLRWTQAGAPSIAAGRNGNGASLQTTASIVAYHLGVEDATVTVGFAWRINTAPPAGIICRLFSDNNITEHIRLQVNVNGSIEIRRGLSNVLGTTTTGLIVANTWYYIELQVFLSDTVGTVTVRVNGSNVIGPLTNQDTKNAGTKTVFDTFRLEGPGSATTSTFDDLYLKVGAGETFNGDTVVPSSTLAVLARESVRVGLEVPYAHLTTRLLRHSVRVGIGPAPPGVFVNAWSGSAFGADQRPTIASAPNALSSAGEGGARYSFAKAGQVVGLRYQRYLIGIQTYSLQAWKDSTSAKATEVVDVRSAQGTYTVTFPTPVPVAAGETWTFTYASTNSDVPINNAGATVANTPDVAFIEYRYNFTYNLYPSSVTTNACYVEPIFEAGTPAGFVTVPLKVWNGAAFVDPIAVKSWNGSAFV